MESTNPPYRGGAAQMRTTVISYDEKIVRQFVIATAVWGTVGMLVGVLIALQLSFWKANMGPLLSFGRLRPLHTNAVIFAFAGNAIFAAIYYSTQRLCKARMFSDTMSRIHVLGLASDHRIGCNYTPVGAFYEQGIRRVGVAH